MVGGYTTSCGYLRSGDDFEIFSICNLTVRYLMNFCPVISLVNS